MLKAEEIPCLDKGFVVLTDVSGTVSGWSAGFISVITFFSGAFSGIFISCFSLRNGASIKNFFF
ncbi:hypothetical protein ACM40_16435 [Chryseobacterium sp. BLS98]|nr:hypothetical protein ACM40_16435 [Chryseobacterium sp. BLS98]